MPRHVLDEFWIHPAVRGAVAASHRDIVEEVQASIADNRVVIIGMATNPMVSGARKLLDKLSVSYRYLEYGNYLSQWRRRNALKMWSGWPTFPIIFVDGMLIGGFQDLKALADSGELMKLLNAERVS
ncbi:MAG: glutaredoxin domain-containing protein [Burkholderiaceae bacterium]|jgi:glutaredoxin-related protein